MPKPKALLVAHWDWVLWNYRIGLAEALRDVGWEPVFVCPPGHYARRFKAAGFRCVEWSVTRDSLNPVREIRALAHLVRIYGEERPDLAHHFTIKPNLYGSMAVRLLRLFSRGSAAAPRSVSTFTGLGFLYGSQASARLLRMLVRPFLAWGLRDPVGWTVFQTRGDRDRLVREGVVLPERSVVIPGSGVDTRRIRPPDHRSNRTPVVLLASRLLWDKGVAEFVEAASALKSSGVDAEFWLAGAPDPGNPASIPEEKVRTWHQSGVIRWLGHREDIPELLARADIAALPSYAEGVPLFLLEAAACGLPIVASDIEGCRAVVDHGVSGMLVPPRDAESLAATLETLIRDRDLRQRMGSEGRRIAVERFDSRHVIDQFFSLYERVLGSPVADHPTH